MEVGGQITGHCLPPQILPNALRSSLAWSSWVKCYKAGIQLAGNQVLGLKALQRTDFMTFCLCVPDCVRAATDHAMDHSGDSHRLEGLGGQQWKPKLQVNTRHLIALPGRAVVLRLLSWSHFRGDPEVTLVIREWY